MDSQSLTPKVIKEELDRYVIGLDDAKKAVDIGCTGIMVSNQQKEF